MKEENNQRKKEAFEGYVTRPPQTLNPICAFLVRSIRRPLTHAETTPSIRQKFAKIEPQRLFSNATSSLNPSFHFELWSWVGLGNGLRAYPP